MRFWNERKGGFMKKFLLAAAILFVFLTAYGDVFAGELKLKPRMCAVFKNGVGMFVEDGEADISSVSPYVWLGDVPPVSHGSLWILTYDKETKVDEAVAYKDDLAREAVTLTEQLQANVGKKVKIMWGDKEITGTIQSLPMPDKKTLPPQYGYYNPPDAPSVVNIKTDKGLVSLPVSSVSMVEFQEDYNKMVTIKEGAKKLRLKVSSSKPSVKLGISFLRKGITWAPSYLVDISSAKKAKIIMSATVVNDAEELEGVDVSFVVGYPHFLFQDVVSPLALDEDVGQFLSALTNLGSTGHAGPMANMMAQSAMPYSESAPVSTPSYSASSAGNLSGETAEDLFFYPMKNVTLKKGERAYYTVFAGDADYKHIYEWNIPETALSSSSSSYSYNNAPPAEEQEQVWHSLKLTNATDVPWTTAPAMTVLNFKALGQDVLNYTPKGAATHLKITLAPDIKVKRAENEKERKHDALSLYGYTYDLVTVEGKLTLKNFKNQSVTMDVTKMVSGELSSVSDNGKVEKMAEALKSVNPSSRITWEFPLKAGEEKNITYSYKIYIRP